MNAIKLYASTARLILENDHYDFSKCKEIATSFPSLEQSLTCTVCRNILIDPYSPIETSCQHHVCKTCVGGRKKLRPSCSWCKDYSKYVQNSQLHCVLVCYKGLCEYVKCTNLLSQLADFFPSYNETDKNVINVVQKGSELPYGRNGKDTKADKRSNTTHDSIYDANLSPGNSDVNDSSFLEVGKIKDEPRLDPVLKEQLGVKTEAKINDITEGSTNSEISRVSSYDESVSDGVEKPMYSVTFSGTKSKLILKRRTSVPRQVRRERDFNETNNEQLPIMHALRTQDYAASQNVSTNDNSRFRKTKPKSATSSDRPNCRCGNATPKPGKLTCCGQRCACYMQSKACTGCRCRGCRNPHMFDGVKVLGRFMKEESQDPNSSTFQELSTNFLNQQISYILPEMPSSTVLNIS